MKHVKYISIIALIYLFSNISLLGQDPQFSQFYANPLYLAPSFAGGSKRGSRITMNYRNQWPAIKKTYQTYNISFDHYFPKIRSGVGLFYTRDVAGSGDLHISSLGFQYSFDFQISHLWHIKPGLSFSYMRTGINFDKLKFYAEIYEKNIKGNLSYDPAIIPPFESRQDFDFASSVMAYNDQYWFGVKVDHFLKPDLLFYKSSYIQNKPLKEILKYSCFGGVKLRLRDNLLKYYKESLSFTFHYKQQHTYKQLDIGTYYHKNPLVFGLWYRGIPLLKNTPGHDALVFLVGYKISHLNIGYSFDFTISDLQIASGGAHEISFVWDFKIKKRQKDPEALPCPDI